MSQDMIGIAILLLLTFGLSRLLHWIVADRYPARKRNVIANVGSVLIVSLFDVALFWTDSDGPIMIAVAVGTAAACQMFWYCETVPRFHSLPSQKLNGQKTQTGRLQ